MTQVSTSAFYDRATAGMAALRARAQDLQTAIGTGQRLVRPSDDPVAASRLRMLGRSDALAAVDSANAARAAADLTLADGALSGFADAIVRAQELATQAASGTLSTQQRSAIGNALAQLHQDLVQLANSRDSAGHALFGGEATGPAYTLDALGNALYAGTAGSGAMPLGDGQTVARAPTGPEFLALAGPAGPTDLLAVVKGLADALQGAAADPAQAARDALGSLTAALDAVGTAQTVVGGRLNWIDLAADRHARQGETRASEETATGATDLAATVTRLQQVLSVLEASQASFTRLAGLSLFALLR